MNLAEELDQWEVIEQELPRNWETLARETGALVRLRQVRDARTLLRLILLHTGSSLSLEQTVLRADLGGLCKLSDVALLKRLRGSREWLRQLCALMLTPSEEDAQALATGYRWLAIDASQIMEPGPTGSIWRLHYALSLPSLECAHFELTSQQQGERLGRWQLRPNDVLLLDRGYSHRSGAAHALESGAHLVMRLNPLQLTLQGPDGEGFNLEEWLEGQSEQTPAETKVSFLHNEKFYGLRLCALRKSKQATERTRQQMHSKARRQRKALSDRAITWAGYTMIVTSLPEEHFATERIFRIYRCRWQVELAFKRLKTLLNLGHLPKRDPESSQAWLLAKLLASLIIQALLRRTRDLTPWGYDFRAPMPVGRVS